MEQHNRIQVLEQSMEMLLEERYERMGPDAAGSADYMQGRGWTSASVDRGQRARRTGRRGTPYPRSPPRLVGSGSEFDPYELEDERVKMEEEDPVLEWDGPAAEALSEDEVEPEYEEEEESEYPDSS